MSQKILFFTGSRIPTNAEKLAIAEIVALCQAPYEMGVRNPIDSPNYGTPESADFVAGTVPNVAPYKDLPVFDPENPPVVLPDNQAVVSDNDAITVTAQNSTATATVNVVDGAVVDVEVSSSVEFIRENDNVAIANSAVVAKAVVPSVGSPSVSLPATAGVVTNGQVLAVTGGNVTLNVAANVVTATYTATP